jgi:hypothetical protein
VIHTEFWARYLGEWAAYVASGPAVIVEEPREPGRPGWRTLAAAVATEFEATGPAVELAESRVLERLAELTARLGPWEAAVRLFGVHGAGGGGSGRPPESALAGSGVEIASV